MKPKTAVSTYSTMHKWYQMCLNVRHLLLMVYNLPVDGAITIHQNLLIWRWSSASTQFQCWLQLTGHILNIWTFNGFLQVEKIFGPGNQYVTAAKMILQVWFWFLSFPYALILYSLSLVPHFSSFNFTIFRLYLLALWRLCPEIHHGDQGPIRISRELVLVKWEEKPAICLIVSAEKVPFSNKPR